MDCPFKETQCKGDCGIYVTPSVGMSGCALKIIAERLDALIAKVPRKND